MSNTRKELIYAARDLFEEQGLGRTTVKDITERCEVSRALFYHYFPDKEAIISAVLDDFVEDFTEAVRLWNESRIEGDIEGALRDCIKMMRRVVFDTNYFRKALASQENAGLYLEFLDRATTTLSTYVVETTVKDYKTLHDVEIEYVPETFYVLITGLAVYLRRYPDLDDEVLMAIVRQTLRLETDTRACPMATK